MNPSYLNLPSRSSHLNPSHVWFIVVYALFILLLLMMVAAFKIEYKNPTPQYNSKIGINGMVSQDNHILNHIGFHFLTFVHFMISILDVGLFEQNVSRLLRTI